MALDPNIILQAGRGVTSPDLAALLMQRNQIKLSALAAKRGQQTQDALERVKADPSDYGALSDLAALDPTAANGYLGVKAAERAGATRSAMADLYRASAPGQPQAAAPPAPAAPAMTLPATGQSLDLPSGDAPAPSGGKTDPFSHAGPAEQIVGAGVTSGKMTMHEAAAHLAEVADPAQVTQVLTSLKTMDDLQFDRVTRTNKTMADTLAAIKSSVPDDASHAARHAALMQNAPQLAELGITPQQLAQLDLSDRGINGVVGKAMGYAGLLEQANKDRTAAREEAQLAETRRSNLANENKPVSASFGTTLVNPKTGEVVYDGTGSAGETPPPGPGRLAQLTDVLAGFAPGITPTSAIRTPAQQQALVAAGKTFATNSAHLTGDAIDIPAAPGLSVKAIQSAYAAAGVPVKVIQETGVGSGQGTGPHFHIERVASSRGAGGASADAIANDAENYIAHGLQMAPGSSRNQAYVAAVRNRAAELMKERGITPEQAIAGGQDFKSAQSTLTEFTKGKSAATVRSLNVAVDHLDQLAEASKALQNGNTPVFNRIAQAYAKQTGSPVPTNFDAIKDFVTDEVTKAIIGAGGGVADREAASNLVSRANSPAQLAGAISNIQGLMGGQLNGLRLQYEQGTGRKDFERFVSPRAQTVLEHHVTGGGTVPAAAAAYLRANPSLRSQFDEKYGAGASARVLGG